MFHGVQGQSGTQSCGTNKERGGEIVQQKELVLIPVPQAMQHATVLGSTAEKTPLLLQMATKVTGVSVCIVSLLVHVFDLQEFIIFYYTQLFLCKVHSQHLLLMI